MRFPTLLVLFPYLAYSHDSSISYCDVLGLPTQKYVKKIVLEVSSTGENDWFIKTVMKNLRCFALKNVSVVFANAHDMKHHANSTMIVTTNSSVALLSDVETMDRSRADIIFLLQPCLTCRNYKYSDLVFHLSSRYRMLAVNPSLIMDALMLIATPSTPLPVAPSPLESTSRPPESKESPASVVFSYSRTSLNVSYFTLARTGFTLINTDMDVLAREYAQLQTATRSISLFAAILGFSMISCGICCQCICAVSALDEAFAHRNDANVMFDMENDMMEFAAPAQEERPPSPMNNLTARTQPSETESLGSAASTSTTQFSEFQDVPLLD